MNRKYSQRVRFKINKDSMDIPSSEYMFPDTKYGGKTNTMMTMEFFKKVSHLQGFLKIIILKYKY